MTYPCCRWWAPRSPSTPTPGCAPGPRTGMGDPRFSNRAQGGSDRGAVGLGAGRSRRCVGRVGVPAPITLISCAAETYSSGEQSVMTVLPRSRRTHRQPLPCIDYFQVGREKIREFALAIKDDHPRTTARPTPPRRLPGRCAPLTFLAVAGRRVQSKIFTKFRSRSTSPGSSTATRNSGFTGRSWPR